MKLSEAIRKLESAGDLRPAQKFIILWYIAKMDETGMSYVEGAAKLWASEVGMSSRNFQLQMRELSIRGVIETENTKNSVGAIGPNRYRLGKWYK